MCAVHTLHAVHVCLSLRTCWTFEQQVSRVLNYNLNGNLIEFRTTLLQLCIVRTVSMLCEGNGAHLSYSSWHHRMAWMKLQSVCNSSNSTFTGAHNFVQTDRTKTINQSKLICNHLCLDFDFIILLHVWHSNEMIETLNVAKGHTRTMRRQWPAQYG